MTYNGLTKQVTFTPYYILINNSPFSIECQEFDRPADPWRQVDPKSCKALWPKSEKDDKLLKLKIVGTEEISAPFLFTESHTTLLKLKNKVCKINSFFILRHNVIIFTNNKDAVCYIFK